MTEKCTAVNLRRGEYDVYIGRAGKGQDGYFGNPYCIGQDGGRDDVLSKFKDYFHKRLEQDTEFRQRVLDLRGKRLGCFCKPHKCHGDIIAEWVNTHGHEESDGLLR